LEFLRYQYKCINLPEQVPAESTDQDYLNLHGEDKKNGEQLSNGAIKHPKI
jgi:hypothetical protein